MANSLREFIRDRSTSWLAGALSGAWNQIVNGVSGDVYIQVATLAHRMGWLLDDESPDDALPLFAAERRLPRYVAESVTSHRERLHNAWEIYKYAGSDETLLEQLEAAGYGNGVIVTASEWPTVSGPNGELPYWSQFWIFFPIGSHPVTSPGPEIGSFIVGDGTTIGPEGITSAQIKELRAIVRKWKPSRWICRQVIFQITGWTVGDGSVVGDPGLVLGGERAVITV
jgi:hypothetical protein